MHFNQNDILLNYTKINWHSKKCVAELMNKYQKELAYIVWKQLLSQMNLLSQCLTGFHYQQSFWSEFTEELRFVVRCKSSRNLSADSGNARKDTDAHNGVRYSPANTVPSFDKHRDILEWTCMHSAACDILWHIYATWNAQDSLQLKIYLCLIA